MMQLHKLRLVLAPPGSTREQVFLAGRRAYKAVQRMFSYSWEAYCFQRFKHSRRAVYLSHLDELRTPATLDKVSIVLPVYNGADYVTEALDSILAQTFTNFELIAVDDGSTDTTLQILDDYATRDSRMRVIHQTNQRLPNALNTGFRAATAEFLTWVSADNRLKPDFLSRMVDSLRRHAEWDAVYANVDIIGDDGGLLLNSEWYNGYQKPIGSGHVHLPRDLSELNVVANNYVGAAFMYRRRVYFLLGDYSPHRFGTEDYDYWMRVNGLLNLHHTDFPEQVYEYRFHATSLTSRDEELGITRSREGLMVFEDARRDFYNNPLAWLIADDADPRAQACVGQIREWAAAASHVLLDPAHFDLNQMSRLWSPLVAVKVTVNPFEAVPDPAWPANAYKVLVAASRLSLPRSVDPAWDLCITIPYEEAALPSLSIPRQGWLGVLDVRTLCTVIDVRVKSSHLARLETEVFNPSPSSCKISVVICTYHRVAQLADAIHSVAEQTFSADDYEVVIVNNDPADTSVSEVVASLRESHFSDAPERLRLVMCPYKGLSCARNAGISEARGEIVCFLDDDAVASSDWLEKIWKAFEQFPEAGVTGGTILLNPPTPRPKWFQRGWEGYWSHFAPAYPDLKQVTRWFEFPYGANWCAPRRALLEMGGFRTRYGRRGTDFGGGEEIIAASLIKRLGYTIAVEPRAVVTHNVEPERFTLYNARQTILAGERTWYRLQTDLYIPYEISIWNLFKRFAGKVSKLFSWGPVRTWFALLAECQVLWWVTSDQLRRFRKPVCLN